MTKKLSLLIASVACLGLAASLSLSTTIRPAEAQIQQSFPNLTVGRDLFVGMRGEDVVLLQGLMSELGYLNVPISIPLGYYGPLTRDAVADYQRANNVNPPTGYFGPLTKIAMHQQFTSEGWLTLLGWR